MIIDGKARAEEIKKQIKNKVEKDKLDLTLAVVLVGENPASVLYVKNKKLACEKVGIKSIIIELAENTSQKELNKKLDQLSSNLKINGILLQLPLPNHLSSSQALSHLSYHKDVDGLTTENLGFLFSGNPHVVPCTPKGILNLIKTVKPNLVGENVVVVGRSNLVGKPTAQLLLNENCTVTICHSKTKNLIEHTKNADILIVAIGKPKFITKDMIKENSVIIDVGINRTDDGIVGDVDFENVSLKASHITPVPKGVGPMTVAMLLENLLELSTRNVI